MSESLTGLKKQFNALLTRCNKAEKYINAPERTEEELEKWMPEFMNIIAQLSFLLEEIGVHTEDEAINGFKE